MITWIKGLVIHLSLKPLLVYFKTIKDSEFKNRKYLIDRIKNPIDSIKADEIVAYDNMKSGIVKLHLKVKIFWMKITWL